MIVGHWLPPGDTIARMNAETIREWLGRRPFEPFVVRLSNGELHEVRLPKNVLILRSRIIIGYPESDRAVHCALEQINAIEAFLRTLTGTYRGVTVRAAAP